MRYLAAIGVFPAMVLLGVSTGVRAQVFEVKGGASTLYDAQGGTVTVHARGFDASGGLGMVDGRLVGGGEWVRKTAHATYTLGSENIPFNLPTDIFDSDHYLTGIGASVRAQLGLTEETRLFVFAGATSSSFNSPFFDGARAEQPAAVVCLTQRVGPAMSAVTSLMLSRQTTMIESLEWQPNPGVRVAVSGGVGAGQPYGAASVWMKRRTMDVQAAYIETGSAFRRVDVTTPLTSEPVKENVMMTWRPVRQVSLSAARQNYLTPVAGTESNARSTVNQLSGTLDMGGWGVSATVYGSSFEGSGDRALAVSVNREVTQRMGVNAMLLAARARGGQAVNSLVMDLHEELSPRWMLTETVNTSVGAANGQTTVGFGGSYLSNWLTVSSEYQTYYVPERVGAPFEQALLMDAKLHVLGRMTIGAGTFVAPDGKVKYTSEIDGVLAREEMGKTQDERSPVGQMVIRGRVTDGRGGPVAGASLLVDRLQLYTDSRGFFCARERHSRRHVLTVLVDQFLDGGSYRVVSAPVTVESGTEEKAAEVTIVVEAVRRGFE